MTPTNRKLLIAIAVASLVILVAILGLRKQVLNSTLHIDVVPSGSKISVNGKSSSEGNIQTRPGTYKVVVSHSGFESVTRVVNLRKDHTEYVGIILTSNSPKTANWYETHPEDAKKGEGISSKTFLAIGDAQQQKLPLIKKLPYSERQFQISNGNSQLSPDDPTKVAIYITYYTEEGKQEALTWIQSQGYNPAKLEIIYTPSSFEAEQ
jgi:hypothetical protein